MDKNRLWMLGAALLIGIASVLGWLLGISPKLDEARTAKTEQVAVEAQNLAYEIELTEFKEQFENIGELKQELALLRRAIPSAAAIPAFVGQLDSIAQRNQVTLTTISVSDAQANVPVAAEVAPAPAAKDGKAATDGADTADSAAAGDNAAAADSATAAAAPAASKSVIPENLIAVPISLTLDGSYDNVLNFIEGLQRGERQAMVTAFTTEAPDSGGVSATISALVYVLVDKDAEAAATPTG